jgi:hypothetical protein
MRRCLLYFGLILGFPLGILAQKEGGRNVLSPGQIWNEVAITQQTGKRFVSQLDLQWSGSSDVQGGLNISKHTINYGGRVWQHYYPNPNLKLSGFLGYWFSPNTPEINQMENTEVRLALQAQHVKRWSRYSFYNRIRYERRVLTPPNNGNDIENRFRYMPKLFIGLNHEVIDAGTFYGILSDEIFMKMGNSNFLDQNRLTLGIGYCLNKHMSLELAYVNRFISNQNAANEFTQAISISVGINDLFTP